MKVHHWCPLPAFPVTPAINFHHSSNPFKQHKLIFILLTTYSLQFLIKVCVEEPRNFLKCNNKLFKFYMNFVNGCTCSNWGTYRCVWKMQVGGKFLRHILEMIMRRGERRSYNTPIIAMSFHATEQDVLLTLCVLCLWPTLPTWLRTILIIVVLYSIAQ